jgi:hypothetical protein
MITVEVLVSMLILFLVIATSSITIRHFLLVQRQQVRHEEVYSAVLSVQDWLDTHQLCYHIQEIHGTLDGFDFTATCQLIKENRSYQKSYDEAADKMIEGNTGPWLIRLYRVELDLRDGVKTYQYHYNKSITIDTLKEGKV